MTPSRLAGCFLLFSACSSDPSAEGPAPKGEAPTPVAPAPTPAPEKTLPIVRPPAPPAGSVLSSSAPWLYIQTCSGKEGCPQLLQPAAEKHCRSLDLGGHHSWRLPSKDEIPRFSKLTGLEDLAGYHWSRSPYAEDHKQAWIVDPAGSPPTTIPRDRKPMRTRCVMTP